MPLAAVLGLGATGLLIAAAQAFPAVLDAEGASGAQGLAYAAVIGTLLRGRGARRTCASRARASAPASDRPAARAWCGDRDHPGSDRSRPARGDGRRRGRGRALRRRARRELETYRDALLGGGTRLVRRPPGRRRRDIQLRVEWLRERDEVDRALDAHSLYVETLAELGIVGSAAARGLPGGRGRRDSSARARGAPRDPVLAALPRRRARSSCTRRSTGTGRARRCDHRSAAAGRGITARPARTGSVTAPPYRS